MISSIIQKLFFLLKFRVIKKRNNKEFITCLTPKPGQSFFVYPIQNKENIFTEKQLFKDKEGWRIEQKRKEAF